MKGRLKLGGDMSKTAMQQLIEYIDGQPTFNRHLLKRKAKQLLKEEKSLMFHSFYAGAGSDDKTDHEDQFNEYYKECFEQ